MDIKSKIRQEMYWKVDLCSQGTRIEKGALEGENFRENVNWIFEWNAEDPPPYLKIPAEIVFPEGTVVKLSYNPKSSYIIRKEDSGLFLEQHGKFISPIKFPERPEFYDKKTSGGILMQRIVPLGGEDGFFACLTTTCNYFATGDECKFCNMNPALAKADHQALLSPGMAEQVAEVLEACLDEGIDPCLVITSGSLPEKTYCEAAIRITESIKKRPKCAHLARRICCQMEAPKDLSWLDKLHEAGVGRVQMNLEIWDPDVFRYICPGKAKRIGRDHWLKALRYAVKVFGTPSICTALIAGIETKDTIYEASDQLTDMGIWPLISPLWTQGGTALDDHRPPHPEWSLEVTEKVTDMIVKRMPQILDIENFYLLACYRCDDVFPAHDEFRVWLNGYKKVSPKEIKQARAN